METKTSSEMTFKPFLKSETKHLLLRHKLGLRLLPVLFCSCFHDDFVCLQSQSYKIVFICSRLCLVFSSRFWNLSFFKKSLFELLWIKWVTSAHNILGMFILIYLWLAYLLDCMWGVSFRSVMISFWTDYPAENRVIIYYFIPLSSSLKIGKIIK